MTGTMTRAAAHLAQLVLVTLALIAATVAIGWWGIPLAGFVWGFWTARPARHDTMTPRIINRAATRAAIAAALAWGGILLWTATAGPLPALITVLGQLAGAPGPVLLVPTLVFPALLAWSAATLGTTVRAYLPITDRLPPGAISRGGTSAP